MQAKKAVDEYIIQRRAWINKVPRLVTYIDHRIIYKIRVTFLKANNTASVRLMPSTAITHKIFQV